MRSELTIGHEYVHLANCINGNMVSKYQEFAAYMWESSIYSEIGDIAWMNDRIYNAQDFFNPNKSSALFYDVTVKPYTCYDEWVLFGFNQ